MQRSHTHSYKPYQAPKTFLSQFWLFGLCRHFIVHWHHIFKKKLSTLYIFFAKLQNRTVKILRNKNKIIRKKFGIQKLHFCYQKNTAKTCLKCVEGSFTLISNTEKVSVLNKLFIVDTAMDAKTGKGSINTSCLGKSINFLLTLDFWVLWNISFLENNLWKISVILKVLIWYSCQNPVDIPASYFWIWVIISFPPHYKRLKTLNINALLNIFSWI